MENNSDHATLRRSSRRFPLKLPVVFRWKADNGCIWQGRGVTRDISGEGVFITADFCPPVRTAVSLRMLLPTTASGRQVRINADAVVLRADAGECGFAVQGQKRFWVSKSQAEPMEVGQGLGNDK